ncbi:MAG: hypothetical protein CMO01_20825 [Thalassobius sp.]|nr:hypothetical protein [Thalassovita sp.]
MLIKKEYYAFLLYICSVQFAFAQSDTIPVKLIDASSYETATNDGEGAILEPIGTVVDLETDLLAEGIWKELKAGRKSCTLAFSSESVEGINFYFKDMVLPASASLYLSGNYKNQELGPFTNKDLHNGIFSSSFVFGDYVEMILEVDESDVEQTNIIIESAGLAFKDVIPEDNRKGFGDASSCNVNINCSEGDLWKDVSHSVVRILVRSNNAIGWCSGVLMNNTNQDFTPYILTAMHCGMNSITEEVLSQTNFDKWIFFFNYEVDDCSGIFSSSDVTEQYVTGADLISYSDDGGGERGSDFLLLRLQSDIPEEYNPVFAGWSNIEGSYDRGVSIHHPEGDIKKISTYNTLLESSTYSSDANIKNTHWQVFWSQTNNGFGVTEGGSSGAPLFNVAGQVVGTLTGGTSSCTNTSGFDMYGKIAYDWESNGTTSTYRLKDWLDPSNTGVSTLNSIDYTGNFITDVEDEVDYTLSIYPNPVEDVLYIELPIDVLNSQFNIKLVDTSGKIVINQQFDIDYSGTLSLDLAHLSQGIYVVELNDNELVYRNKILIR